MRARLSAHRRRVDEAKACLDDVPDDGVYVGVSWGKDSVTVAHLASGRWPLVWIREEPTANPDCHRVRDEYLVGLDECYEEILVELREGERFKGVGTSWHATGTLEAGFAEACLRYGDFHVSGVRAGESRVRRLTVGRNGLVSTRSARPLARWSSLDVFGYMLTHGLPIHPAYAFTLDGLLDPLRLRVCSLGGRSADGVGRLEWERRYYRDRLAEIERIDGPGN